MNQEILKATAARLVKPPKGILAIDESFSTCNKRFEKLGIPTTEEKRREYRELLVTAPGVEQYISGYITFDETIRQSTKDGRSFISVLQSKGIEVGIKVDQGLVDFPPLVGEKLTKGLDGLPARMKEYRGMGASFAKWRAEYLISDTTPSMALMTENAKALAQYAKACQDEDIVPIVEPEVMINGGHTIETSYEITFKNLDIIFAELNKLGVFIPGIILKTSMVIAGKECGAQSRPKEVADMTLKCLMEHVPANIGGIVFLSGGQSDQQAVENLNAMHQGQILPWALTFSYGRAIQNGALQSWAKNSADIATAQALLLSAAKNNSDASVGKYVK